MSKLRVRVSGVSARELKSMLKVPLRLSMLRAAFQRPKSHKNIAGTGRAARRAGRAKECLVGFCGLLRSGFPAAPYS